jgi:hypothetical protein
MVSSLLDALPVELKLQVMVNLDSKSLLRFASVCGKYDLSIHLNSRLQVSRSLYLTFRSSSLLRYITQLALYGMEDTGSKISYLNLLFLLRDRQHAWERLEWKRSTTVVVPHYCKAYELVAGVFASSDGKNLYIFGLPSNRNEGYALTRTPNLPIRDFAIDPTEDVVAFLEEGTQNFQRIHIRTISTNAPLSVLTFTVPPGDNFNTPLLQFGWDLLGLHYASRILIWNWNKNSLIFDSSRQSSPHDIGGFVFLSRDTFLITSTSLHIYVFNPPSSVILVATLNLPVTSHGVQIGIHSGPLHGRPPSGVLFTPASSERIQVLSVTYGFHLQYTMFVHTSTLLHYVERYVNGEAIPELVVHWDTWGRQGTRFTKNDVPRFWLRSVHLSFFGLTEFITLRRYVHGQRVIQQRDTTKEPETEVIDFNYVPPSALSDPRANTFSCMPGDNFRRTTFTRSQPTVLPPHSSQDDSVSGGRVNDNPFCTEVTTSLPYHVSSVRLPISFYSCMIDDERIVGVQVRFLFFLNLRSGSAIFCCLV